MADVNGEYPTVIGPDAKFKGELTFEKGVRIEGCFEGQIRSKGSLHVAEGAHVSASVEATNVLVEGECKGDVVVSEKLHLLATAKMEGDLRTNRLEIADGAIFVGNVVVGQVGPDAAPRRPALQGAKTPRPEAPVQTSAKPQPRPQSQPQSPAAPRPRPHDLHIPTGNP